jgi:hypothetical protein
MRAVFLKMGSTMCGEVVIKVGEVFFIYIAWHKVRVNGHQLHCPFLIVI